MLARGVRHLLAYVVGVAEFWRYVASRSRDESTGEFVWEIRELYPTEDGQFGYTANAIPARGESLEELRTDLAHMLSDLDLPVLDLTADPPKLVARGDLVAEDEP